MAGSRVVSGASFSSAGHRGARSPQEFDEPFLEVMAGGNDGLGGGGPNNQYTFIPLRKQ